MQDRYIRVSDQVLLNAVDSITFDHGWTELDIAEKAHPDGPPKKVTGKSREKSKERKKAVVDHDLDLNDSNMLSGRRERI